MYLQLTLIVGCVSALALFTYVLVGLYRYIFTLPGATIEKASSTTSLVRVPESNRHVPISLAQAFLRALMHRHA